MEALALLVALAALAVAGVALAATTAHQRAHRTARFAQQLNAYKRHTDQHTIHTNGQGPRRYRRSCEGDTR